LSIALDLLNKCLEASVCIEFFYELWPGKTTDAEVIDKTERDIIANRVTEFACVWDSCNFCKVITGAYGGA
jgi:hypothetical protein